MTKISVIISTYNAEDWLEKVLWGYSCQTFKDFEIVIADDGSRPATKELIDGFKSLGTLDINHVWQEDDGFQKSRILNKSIVACKSDYIVMSDGDCIPRADFLQIHHQYKEKGYFLSGGYFMLPMDISKKINKEDIISSNCFNVNWLKNNGLKSSFKNNKLAAQGFISKLLNALTPTNASWNGHNASGWKTDIVKVNGFDERMQYGGQDRELGERLFNLGIKSKQIRYSAVCLHLDHKRGYKTPESIAKNQAIRKHTRDSKIPWTPFGIVKD
ncbi:MAG: glycosyltransferase family 2 protein [Flavobacteriaceae bacterium]|jgi:GT2 family glycosyltransferase|nr:glycosyltransferase family 2 protein [Flavobacteriaceae bacterium]